jgi:uracil-DNA glycosylase
MKELLKNIQSCTYCSKFLELGPRPIITADLKSKILIIGQAPGRRVHESGIPWDDKSGDNIRSWMGIDKTIFYDPCKIALVPMGFCYPGKGKSGDLPPRPECAPLWHNPLLNQMKDVQLTLLVGQYAQKYYLREKNKKTLTETVRSYNNFLPLYFPLPHPSPRNFIWMRKNPWFEKEIIPELRSLIINIINKRKKQ